MAVDFQGTIRTFVDSNPRVSGAIFADLDGAEIAAYPPRSRDTLQHCAAYGGIALRRLTVAERLAGRAPIQELVLQGDEGAFMAVPIGSQYQFIATLDGPVAAARDGSAIHQIAQQLAIAAHI